MTGTSCAPLYCYTQQNIYFNAIIASSFIGTFKNITQFIYFTAIKAKFNLAILKNARLNFAFIAVESSSVNETNSK